MFFLKITFAMKRCGKVLFDTVCTLKNANINGFTESIKVLKSYLKTRKDTDPILFRSKKGGPLSRQQLDRLFKGYASKARLPKDKQHFHVLKHSCATHLLELSEDVTLVQKWLGHKEIKNTMVYADLIGLTVNNRVKALSEMFPKAG